MSRLTDFPTGLVPVERQSYESGNPNYNQALVEQVATLPEVALPHGRSIFNAATILYFQQSILPILETEPDFDGQAFLDAVVQKMVSETRPHLIYWSSYMFCHLTNALHSIGHSNLVLDLRPLGSPLEKVACYDHYFTPTEERPFALRVMLEENPGGFDADYVGFAKKYCTMHIQASSLKHVAEKSSHSEFILETQVERLGKDSSDCSFRFPRVCSIEIGEPFPLEDQAYTFIKQERQERTLLMREADGVYEAQVDGEFFDKGNSILIANGEGGWKEVTP